MQQRAAEEDNYRCIFENAVKGFFRTSPERRYPMANPARARGTLSQNAFSATKPSFG
jgi:hypothetical protein